MEWAPKASAGGPAEAGLPEEPLGSQIPAEAPPPEGPESRAGLAPADRAAGAGQGLPGGQQPPSPRPLSLGYGAFRRLGSSSREPPSPGPAAPELPGDGEAAWAPVELQVDVRVKQVGSASGSRAPSPAPPTRFLTVPVPESPAPARRPGPAHPLPQRAPSAASSWGRSSPLAAAPAERAPGSPAPRCRCQEPGLEKEDAALLQRAGMDGQKVPRAISLIGLPMYMKSLRWALAVMAVLLAVSTVSIVALASRVGAKCRPCPQGWMWFEEHCYYLSLEAQDWEAGQAFCSAHRATLPLLIHTQAFLSRCPITRSSWVGARRGPQGWHWIDGTPLPPQLLQEEGKDDPGLSCGSLEDGRLVALNCSSPRTWVCAKGTQ